MSIILKIQESVGAKKRDYKDSVFTLKELVKIYGPFLDRLVDNHGNKREDMIKYHLEKMVGLPYRQAKAKAPRGPGRGWTDLMADTNIGFEEAAKKKAGWADEEIEASYN